MAGALGILGGISALLSPLAPAMLALAAAFGIFGASIFGIGAGVAALATGFGTLAVVGSAGAVALVEAIKVILTGIVTLAPELAAAATVAISSLASAIAQSAPVIGEAVSAILQTILKVIADVGPALFETVAILIKGFLETLVEHGPDILAAGAELVGKLVTAIAEHGPDVLRTGSELLAQFIQGILSLVGDLVSTAAEVVGEFVSSIIESIGEAKNQFINSAKELAGNIIEGLKNGLLGGIAKVKEAIAGVANGIIDGFKDLLGIHSPSVVMNEMGHYIVQGLAEGIKKDMSAEEAARQKAQNIVEAFQSEFDKVDLDKSTADLKYELWEALYGETATDAEKQAAEVSKLYEDITRQVERVRLAQDEYTTTLFEMSGDTEKIQEAFNKYLQEQIDLANLQNDLREAQKVEPNVNMSKEDASMIMDSMMSSVDERLPFANEAGQNTAQAFVSGVTTQLPNVQTSGASTVQNYSQGITSTSQIGVQAFTGMMSQSVAAANGFSGDFYNVGSNMMAGLALGITNNKSEAINAAVDVAREALEAAEDELDIASPSGKFMEVGKYSDQGMALGFSKYAGLVKTSAKDVGRNALDAMRLSISSISDLITDNIDATPTIRPVLDLSSVQAQSGMIGNIFSGQTLQVGGLRSNTTYGLANSSYTTRYGTSQIQKTDNTDLLNALSALGDRVDQLGDRISKMQLVMDTGATVGQIESTMDKRLGIIASRKRRGI